MRCIDAVEEVLRRADGPLHYTEIARRIRDEGLWSTVGRTPEATVRSALAADIRERGSASRFIRAAPGRYTLNPEVTEAPAPDTEPEAAPGLRPSTGPHTAAGSGSEESGETMTFADAAEQILNRFAGRRPMHYREITDRALELGLLATEGRTPAATMAAAIGSEIRRREEQGERPRFVRHGPGMVGLSAWTPVGVVRLIDDRNREVRHALLARARAGTPDEFESLVGEVLVAMGFEHVEVTPIRRDGGIDVRGTMVVGDAVRIRMAVQAKRWNGNVQTQDVQRVRGSLGAHEQGLIITTSDFSSGARQEAARPDAAPVGLMNGEQLAALLVEHEIGATSQSYRLFTLDGDEETEIQTQQLFEP